MILGAEGPPSVWQWIADNGGRILSLTAEHLELALIAVVIGVAISIPLSVLAYRRTRLYPPITWTAGVLYTIPSIALFVVLIPVTGLTATTVEIGLVSYTILILVRNTVAGLRGVPDDLKQAATGMGHTRRQLLWRVELPVAVPAIVAGVRVATVSTVGLVAVGFIVGKGGLGELIIDGLDRFYTPEVVVGSVLSIALALVVDGVLLLAGRAVTPWARAGGRRGARRSAEGPA